MPIPSPISNNNNLKKFETILYQQNIDHLLDKENNRLIFSYKEMTEKFPMRFLADFPDLSHIINNAVANPINDYTQRLNN